MCVPRFAAAAVLLGTATLLAGCYAARQAIPTDASGMAYPSRWFSRTFSDQADRFGDYLTGWPSALGRHTAECWKNITVDPRDVPK